MIRVAGENGFLGSYIVEQLTLLGLPFESISRTDLCHLPSALRFAEGADTIIHAAGDVGGISYNAAHPGSIAYNNLAMGMNLIEACRRKRVRKLVLIGTICSYPKITPVPFEEDYLWNGYPEETNAPYGIAKKTLLTLAEAYRRQYGMDIVYLMPTNLYGPRDHFNEDGHVIPNLIRRIDECKRMKSDLIVWGDGTATRDFLYVTDAARAIAKSVLVSDLPSPMNLGTGTETSIKELVDLLTDIMQFTGNVTWDATRPNGQPRRVLNVERAKNALGWSYNMTLNNGLRETVEWYYRGSE